MATLATILFAIAVAAAVAASFGVTWLALKVVRSLRPAPPRAILGERKAEEEPKREVVEGPDDAPSPGSGSGDAEPDDSPAMYFPTPRTELGLAKPGEEEPVEQGDPAPAGASCDSLDVPSSEDGTPDQDDLGPDDDSADDVLDEDLLDALEILEELDAEDEAKAPETRKVGVAYEARCRTKGCGLGWRLPGLWAAAPVDARGRCRFRCPACREYAVEARAVFKVRSSSGGAGAVVLLLCLALDGCGGPAPPGAARDVAPVESRSQDVADVASSEDVANVTSDTVAPVSSDDVAAVASAAEPEPALGLRSLGDPPAKIAEPAPFPRSTPHELLGSLSSAVLSRDLASLARMRLPRTAKPDLDVDDLARADRDFVSNGRAAFWVRVLTSVEPGSLRVEGDSATYTARVGGALGRLEVVLERVGDEWLVSRP